MLLFVTGEACPFLHGLPLKEAGERAHSNRSSYQSNSEAEWSEGCASTEEGAEVARPRRNKGGAHGKCTTSGKRASRLEFDLEADFPSLSRAADLKTAPRGCPAAHSRPIPISNQGHGHAHFASADQGESSLENTAANGDAASIGVKRRRRKFPSQRQASAAHVVRTRD